MRPLLHRALTWGWVAVGAVTFLVALVAYAAASPLPVRTALAPAYVALALGWVVLMVLRPRGPPTLAVGADRGRWRAVVALGALVACGFLALLLFPPPALLPWALLGGAAMVGILVVAILAILFPPREEDVVHTRVDEVVRTLVPQAAAPFPWAVIYASSSGVAIADGSRLGHLGMDDYFVTERGRKTPLREVESIIDETMEIASERPDDAELLHALQRWGEIIEARP